MFTLTRHVLDYMASRRAAGVYGQKSQRVVAPRLHDFARSHGNRPIHHVNTQTVERWLAELDHRGVARNTKACYLVSVRAFCAWMVDRGHLAANPCDGVPPIRRDRPVPRAQSTANVAKIIDACTDDRERAIVWLMVGCGLRRMEVAGLRWEHWDDRAGIIEVRHSKFGRERVLPVPDEVAAVLGRLRGGGMTGPIIESKRDPHQAISVEHVGRVVRRVMERAGVKHRPYDGVSGHALRHTCASDVLDRSHDLRVVQAMLGHQSLQASSVYLRRATPEQLREAMAGRTYA